MKNPGFFALIFIIGLHSAVNAQHAIYRPFKVDFGISTVFAMDTRAGKGNGFYINPMFNLTDRLCIGPRFEAAFVKKEKIDLISAIFDNKVIDLFSYLVVTDYYFSINRVRFFAGLGSGFFKQKESFMHLGFGLIDFNSNTITNLGLMPRIGYNVGHFKFTINYNMTGDLIYNYLDFTLGLDVGGGLR